MPTANSRKVVIVAGVANLSIAAIKFAAAWFTGSSAMWSEGIHSLVDTTNEVLLLYGLYRASRPPDEEHPFGHGRELYFWSFIVALLIFSLGAIVSLYEGVTRILHPAKMEDAWLSFIVLGVAAAFEGWSWWFSVSEFNKSRGNLSFIEAVRRSKDPATFIVVFEDSAALIGVAIAAAGIAAAEYLNKPFFDGLASVGIALVLGLVAIILLREAKGLLIGEPARPDVRKSILELAQKEPCINRVCALLTFQLGPDQVVALLTVEFAPSLTAQKIEENVAELREKIRGRRPEVVGLFIGPPSRAEKSSTQRPS